MVGLVAGVIVGIHRYREALGLGCATGFAVFVIGGILGSGGEAWAWAGVFLFANVLSYMVFLGLGGAARGLLNRVAA